MNPADYRRELTDRIIKQLESGTAPWQKPWDPTLGSMESPHNAVSGRPYRGGNRLWLDCQGHADPRWATYRQAQEQGWQVRRGEKASIVEYWQWSKTERDASGKEIEVKLDQPRVFYAAVFNAMQMDGVPELTKGELTWEPFDEAEKILVQSGADIHYDKTDAAYYSPRHDQIHMPPKMMFPEPAGFYSVALHELAHWSGHPSRLDRDLVHRFGSSEYALEELRAELASYFVSARLGIPHDPERHASYVGSWISALQNDHNEIHRASRDAENICEFILAFQQEKSLDGEHIAPVLTVVAPTSTATKESTRSGSPRKRSREAELEC